MKIIKFGGSSISDAERIRNVIAIILDTLKTSPRLGVVVSAFGGVTDTLHQIGNLAVLGKEYHESLKGLEERHFRIIRSLLPPNSECEKKVAERFRRLNEFLTGVFLVRDLSSHSLDYLLSFGERLSAYIISESIKPLNPRFCYLDARDVVVTDSHHGSAQVIEEAAYPLIQAYFAKSDAVPIITGFIGRNQKGDTTTLGRGGSDLTAAIFGAALQAEVIEIWTDTDGILTASPKLIPHSFAVPQMTFQEAKEMSYFGAKVIYFPTIDVAAERNIPLKIKNTFNPKESGTIISSSKSSSKFDISGIASIENLDLIRLEGLAREKHKLKWINRFLDVLSRNNIDVYMVSQGSAEMSLTVAIDGSKTEKALKALSSEFYLEIQAEKLLPIITVKDLIGIAAISENARSSPGLSGRLLGSLGKHGINVLGIIGTSRSDVLAIVKKSDYQKAMEAIHQEFFPIYQTLNVFLVGTGKVGRILLNQIQQHLSHLRSRYGLDLKIAGMANSKQMVINPNGIDIDHWEKILHKSSKSTDMDVFVPELINLRLPNSVFVDCSASHQITGYYLTMLKNHISIVTPNKKAITGSYPAYLELRKAAKDGVKFCYETNVGAGLPIISTIASLQKGGDAIHKIEGILSGTLSYIFNTLSENVTFSEALRSAYVKGYTEPNPAEDLDCKDLARKVLILAREIGYPLELGEVAIEPLLPGNCAGDNAEDFFSKLKAFDGYFEEKRREASRSNKVLRLIATIEKEKTRIALQQVDQEHPFYSIKGAENIICITTERYRDNPLVIKGPGAGPEVTAGVLLSNIINLVID